MKQWSQKETQIKHINLVPLKAVSTTFLLVCFLSSKETICKTKKNVFYFILKSLLILEKTKF